MTRSGSTAGSASVDYSTADGSAASGSDYTAVWGTLNFASGESSKTFSVFITNDTIVEAKETFNVVLTEVSNASLANPTTAVVTILDNDKGGRRLHIPRESVLRKRTLNR